MSSISVAFPLRENKKIPSAQLALLAANYRRILSIVAASTFRKIAVETAFLAALAVWRGTAALGGAVWLGSYTMIG